MNKQVVKVIELEGVTLQPGAKYIFCLSPQYEDWVDAISEGLSELIGPSFLLLVIPGDGLKVLEVLPKDGDAQD